MLKKNMQPFTNNLTQTLPFIIKHFFLIAFISASVFLISGCKKILAVTNTPSVLETYFADNVIDKNIKVALTTDSGKVLVDNYSNDTFVLSKTTSFYNGILTCKTATQAYTGTWESNSDYSKLIINLNQPTIIPPFIFLNRSWKFTKKTTTVLELAPWGSNDPKVLHMQAF